MGLHECRRVRGVSATHISQVVIGTGDVMFLKNRTSLGKVPEKIKLTFPQRACLFAFLKNSVHVDSLILSVYVKQIGGGL